MSALIEAVLYVLGQGGDDSIFRSWFGSRFLKFWTDSKYVQGLVEGRFQHKENVPMCIVARHLWNECKKHFHVEILHVMSLSGVLGNERAD